jgi:hypothetical protein
MVSTASVATGTVAPGSGSATTTTAAIALEFDAEQMAQVKIDHPDCQRMVLVALRFLEQHFTLLHPHSESATELDGEHEGRNSDVASTAEESKEADNTPDEVAAASIRQFMADTMNASLSLRGPAPWPLHLPERLVEPRVEHVEDMALLAPRTLLLHHLTHVYPDEPTLLRHRCAQHALFIHCYGWTAYDRHWRMPPQVPMQNAVLHTSAAVSEARAAKRVKLFQPAPQPQLSALHVHAGAPLAGAVSGFMPVLHPFPA